jgi:DNA-binding response OmpR family regulator
MKALDGLRILLVEDAPDIRDAFGLLLKAEGAEVMAAATGREAAGLAGEWSFDVLVSDLGLPDIPGDVLIRHVLATAECPPRVIVVTGYGEPYVSRAREAGADVVLTKPIEWSELVHELRGIPAGGPAAASDMSGRGPYRHARNAVAA